MSNIHRWTVLFAVMGLVVSCAAPETRVTDISIQSKMPAVKIDRHPKPAVLSGNYLELTSVPKFDPNIVGEWQVDLRSRDLTKIDMKDSFSDLIYGIFDSKTQWPSSDNMPVGFDWQKMMELGKDPGLGVRVLHEQGITGMGIGIAIIDQPLLVEHQEYRDRLRLYEEINILPETEAQAHGPAVASIAVGKTVGVAPESDLYYIGAWTGDWDPDTYDFIWNYEYYAQAVHRILEINQGLPEYRKIRVIAMQTGWNPENLGYDEIITAVEEAKEAGIFVISSSLGRTYNLYFQGLGRYPLDDPNEFESYGPGLWWEMDFFSGKPLRTFPWSSPGQMLLVPMDSRTTASPTGAEDYVFYRQGGWSWSIPHLAGIYALAAQVKPEITPEEFWDMALKTGKTIKIEHNGQGYAFGVILDPQSLISKLKSK